MDGSIDREVLDIMKEEDVLKSISDPKQANRLILNCFCEFLSEIKGLRKELDELLEVISICSSDKLTAFFKELDKNVKAEKKRKGIKE